MGDSGKPKGSGLGTEPHTRRVKEQHPFSVEMAIVATKKEEQVVLALAPGGIRRRQVPCRSLEACCMVVVVFEFSPEIGGIAFISVAWP